MFAYVARYGMQPMTEIRSMTTTDLTRFASELSKIVKDENAPKER